MSEQQAHENIYDRFAQVTKQTRELVANMEQLQNQITSVLEQNVELSIENDHLRKVIKKMKDQNGEPQLSGSRQNLKELYQQGFHVCNEYFGKRLAPGESCAFCTDVIFGHDADQAK
ncbi:DNA replication initiation control protein YabA [Limosilactobacillus sp.]|jgi:regulator of replication initiation timing|uniref:DNA replication initiation control protein YabA n=1 Tax=Limosilactobacillus sp. TaxID=2773925 RepID=UPI0035A0A286